MGPVVHSSRSSSERDRFLHTTGLAGEPRPVSLVRIVVLCGRDQSRIASGSPLRVRQRLLAAPCTSKPDPCRSSTLRWCSVEVDDEPVVITGTGHAGVEDSPAAADRQRRASVVAAAHQDVVDPAEGPVPVRRVRVLGDEGGQRLTRMDGFPGASVTDADVVEDVPAGLEPHAVRGRRARSDHHRVADPCRYERADLSQQHDAHRMAAVCRTVPSVVPTPSSAASPVAMFSAASRAWPTTATWPQEARDFCVGR